MRAPKSLLALVTAFLFLLAAPAFAQAPPADWKAWRYPDLHVAFRAPPQATPTIQRSMIDVPDAPGVKATDDHITAYDAGHYALMVGVSDWSGNSHAMSVEGVAPGVANGMKAQFVGPVRTIAWPGGEARDYDLKTDTLIIRGRAIVVGRRLFQVLVLSDTGALPANTEAFVASVQPLP
jgi:hypothetical protein